MAFAVAGCALPDYPNQPLPANGPNLAIQALPPHESANEPVILMAFSGGGSRAAALSLDILRQLRGYEYVSPTTKKPVRLIDRVKVISSVSGGSVTAAYFGLHPDRIDDIESQFLVEDNMSTLEWTAANPVTWGRLAFTSFSRIDALRELMDRRLFHGETFADLNNSSNKPAVILNSTDMVAGQVFPFTPQRFDDICSDLSKLPVAVGVTASAAFPIVLTPINLTNYSGTSNCVKPPAEPKWVGKSIDDLTFRYTDIETFKQAEYTRALRQGRDAPQDILYLHLLDGGLADNQGIHSLSDAVISPHGPIPLLFQINTGARKLIVVITVNARSDPDNTLSSSAQAPGVFDMIGSVTSVPLDAATASLNTGLQDLIDQMKAAGKTPSTDASFRGLKVYNVLIDFDLFPSDHQCLQKRVKNIGTSWTLSADQRRDINDAAVYLLRHDPGFADLLKDLKISAPATPDKPDICP